MKNLNWEVFMTLGIPIVGDVICPQASSRHIFRRWRRRSSTAKWTLCWWTPS